MSHRIKKIEGQRFALQLSLDSQKTQAERNRLGQFSTPNLLAQEILQYAATLLPSKEKVKFLDPAIGTGVFYSALSSVFPTSRVSKALGFEIDQHYADPTIQLWKNSSLELRIEDFTNQVPSDRFNLIICNPPYVRHHHLKGEEKLRLQHQTLNASGMKLSGLSGLYCHFMGLSHEWLNEGGVSGWLIPSEFMDVNYGQAVKKYLLEQVTLLRIHRFNPNDVQFADALVSSAIVWFRKEKPKKDHTVEFTFGGSLLAPEVRKDVTIKALSKEAKWTRFPLLDVRAKTKAPVISDFFQIKRGIATGDNGYFILDEETIISRKLPWKAFKPILPSPRYIREDEIKADKDGNPALDRKLFLLDIRLQENEIKSKFPTLWAYLQEGRDSGLSERYICRHRALWYAQENRPAPPIVCTYLGRGDTKLKRPFRFILNNTRATIANVYLAMYPTPSFAKAISKDPAIMRKAWQVLNEISSEKLLGEGRVYGGGLHKLEPRELANVPVPQMMDFLPADYRTVSQGDMFSSLVA